MRQSLQPQPLAEKSISISVDENYFYAVDNRSIAKYDKETGELVDKWEGPEDGPMIHLDSAMIMDGRIYAAHSNYDISPMTSSIEVWDAETMEHVDSYSFGIEYGSLTWLDHHDGFWWATFANYNNYFAVNGDIAYGNNRWTTMLKLDDEFQKVEAWVFPDDRKRFKRSKNHVLPWNAHHARRQFQKLWAAVGVVYDEKAVHGLTICGIGSKGWMAEANHR
jgi:hypothetical protein